MLGKNDASTQTGAIGSVIALSNSIKSIARRHDPSVGGWPLAIFAVVLEHGRILGGQRGEIVDRLVRAGREARGGDVMAQDSAVHYLREECRARNEVAQHVRHIFLPFRSKSLLISGAT